MLVDHLIYVVPDLDDAVVGLADRFGVRAQYGGKHIGLGTHNALLALGPRTYLEIIAPDRGQPEPSTGRPLGIDQATGSGLAGWALACDDIDTAVAQARSHGYDPGRVSDGQRTGPTGRVLRWRGAGVVANGLATFLICWGGTEHPPDPHRAGSFWNPSRSSIPIRHRWHRCLPPSAQMSRSGKR